MSHHKTEFTHHIAIHGPGGSVVVKTLRYYAGGPRIDSRSCHWGIFSVALDGTMCPWVDSASENEYQGFSWGKGGRCVWLTTCQPCSAKRQENPGP